MTGYPSDFERTATTVSQIVDVLRKLGAEAALLKILPKNANDKNQIYIAANYFPLHDTFDMSLGERGCSTSLVKSRSAPGRLIQEAIFKKFFWLKRDDSLVEAKRMKAIIYTQYPEARLSGFQTVENTMPQSLSVEYTKVNAAPRLLVLAKLPGGVCVGLVYIDLSPDLRQELGRLPNFPGAGACKRLIIAQDNSKKLERLLAGVLGKPLRGCRLDRYGKTLPFAGTQVCGYTLEHALDIVPNSGMDGDIFGIELKTHTQVKVTLFTPEPDFGEYAENFSAFMNKYGYKDSDGDYRVTGIHRAGIRCTKSGLTLKVREWHDEEGIRTAHLYDPTTPLTPKMCTVEVVLENAGGGVAAGWSLERLMNCWGAKHNEVVFVSAKKEKNSDAVAHAAGYEYSVTFDPTVMWCSDTSAERLLKAIQDGVIFLDPAPKLHATDHAQNKRRSQWRVNDITKASQALYANVAFKKIALDSGPDVLKHAA